MSSKRRVGRAKGTRQKARKIVEEEADARSDYTVEEEVLSFASDGENESEEVTNGDQDNRGQMQQR